MLYNFNKEILKNKIKAKKLTYQQLAELLKNENIPTAEATIKSWFRKKNPTNPEFEKLEALSKILDADINEFINFKSNLVAPNLQQNTKFKTLAKNTRSNTQSVPVVGEASCGLPITNTYQGEDYVYVHEDIYNPNLYAVIASGDSMLPEISDGDQVVCDPEAQILNGDLVHYTLFGESAIKVYFYDETTKMLTLKPINNAPYFQTLRLLRDDKESMENITMQKVIQIIKTTSNNRKARLKMVGLD